MAQILCLLGRGFRVLKGTFQQLPLQQASILSAGAEAVGEGVSGYLEEISEDIDFVAGGGREGEKEGGFLRKTNLSWFLLGMGSCALSPASYLIYNPLDKVGSPWRQLSCDLAAPWTEPKGLRAMPHFSSCSAWWAVLSCVWTTEGTMAAGSIRSDMLSFFKAKFLFHGFIIHVWLWGRGIAPWRARGCQRALCRSWFPPSTVSILGN